MRITDLTDTATPDHELVVYNGLQGELVLAVQRRGVVTVRITLSPRGAPQILIADPPRERSR